LKSLRSYCAEAEPLGIEPLLTPRLGNGKVSPCFTFPLLSLYVANKTKKSSVEDFFETKIMFNIFAKTISPKDAFNDFQNQGALFIDVRTKSEHDSEHIEGNTHIDIGDESFEEKINALDKNKKYIIYCMSGGRAGRATSIMQKLGFENAHNLKGGITAWKAEALPVV